MLTLQPGRYRVRLHVRGVVGPVVEHQVDPPLGRHRDLGQELAGVHRDIHAAEGETLLQTKELTVKFGGLTALQTRREVYGQQRRTVLTHSPTLHQAQSRGFDQTLAC